MLATNVPFTSSILLRYPPALLFFLETMAGRVILMLLFVAGTAIHAMPMNQYDYFCIVCLAVPLIIMLGLPRSKQRRKVE